MESNGFGEIYPLSDWGVIDSENGFGIVYRGLVYKEIYFTPELENINPNVTIGSDSYFTGVLTNYQSDATKGYDNEDNNKNVEYQIEVLCNQDTENPFTLISDVYTIYRDFINENVSWNVQILNQSGKGITEYTFRILLLLPTKNPFIDPYPDDKFIWIFNNVNEWQ